MYYKPFSVIPALPGYFIQETLVEDGQEQIAIHWDPILAWAFCEELECPIPLTILGEPSYESGRKFYIKDPSGHECRHIQRDMKKELIL